MSSEQHEETIDNTTMVSRILDSNDLNAVKLILGDRERIQHGGVIRPGIKVPLSSCTEKEKQLYAEMYAAGEGFDSIDAALGGNVPIQGQQGKYTKSKLRPSNCNYFRVCRDDFRNPADAGMIMDRYADKGDNHLYRLPIWFPHGALHLVVPHGYRGFGGDGSVKCYSEFDEKGKLICHYIPQDEQEAAKKDRRKPKFTTRVCDQSTCAAYEKKRCDFGGLLKFNVPGMKSMGGVIMPTTSIHGLSEIIASLKSLLNPDLFGRFSGLFEGEPFLTLCKFQKEVTAPDGSRQMQWLPTVELSVDPMELARHASNKIPRGAAAVQMFNGKSEAVPQTEVASASSYVVHEVGKVEPEVLETDPAVQRAMDAIYTLARQSGIESEDITDAYAEKVLDNAMRYCTLDQLRKFYTDLRTLLTTPEGVATVKGQPVEAPPGNDLEVAAMWQEIFRLADAHDITQPQIRDYVTVCSFGQAPEDLTLEDLRREYENLAERFKADAAKTVADIQGISKAA